MARLRLIITLRRRSFRSDWDVKAVAIVATAVPGWQPSYRSARLFFESANTEWQVSAQAMKKTKVRDLNDLVNKIVANAQGDDTQMWAFLQAFRDNIRVPIEASMIGAPVQVLQFKYDGNARRGLTADCLLSSGSKAHGERRRSGLGTRITGSDVTGCVSPVDGHSGCNKARG